MRIAYLYKEPTSNADHMNVDLGANGKGLIYFDNPETKRGELIMLVDKGGLVEGDVLVVTRKSSLGHGKASVRMVQKIEAMGVTVEVSPPEAKPRPSRRKGGKATPEDKKIICAQWHSSADAGVVMDSASRRVGRILDRNALNYMCGNRNKKEQDDG